MDSTLEHKPNENMRTVSWLHLPTPTYVLARATALRVSSTSHPPDIVPATCVVIATAMYVRHTRGHDHAVCTHHTAITAQNSVASAISAQLGLCDLPVPHGVFSSDSPRCLEA